MKRWWLLWFGALVASILIAGVSLAEQGNSAEEAGDAGLTQENEARRTGLLAKIGSYRITVGDFEDHLNKQGPFRRMQFSAPEKRREFLQEMVDRELQAQEADRRGLGDEPSVTEQMKRVMSSLLLRRQVDDQIRLTDVTVDEMMAYYNEHITTFKRPERVRAYHIVISDQEKAQNVLKRLLDEGVETREFRRLAREMSEDPITKRRGGDLRYFTQPGDRQEGEPEVAGPVINATFELLGKRRALQANTEAKAPEKAIKLPGRPEKRPPQAKAPEGFNPIYPKLVKTAQGFHIIRYMGHREAVDRSFEEVERQLRNRSWREKLQKSREGFIEGLREKHRVTINEENLALVKVDDSPGPGKQPMRPRAQQDKRPESPLGRRRARKGPRNNPRREAPQEENE